MFIFIGAFINNLSCEFHPPKTIIFLPLSVYEKLKSDPLGVPQAAKPPPSCWLASVALHDRLLWIAYVINRPGIQ